MALGDILSANPITHANSEVGQVIAKLNELVQREGTDVAFILDMNDPTTHLRYNSATGKIEAVVAGVATALTP